MTYKIFDYITENNLNYPINDIEAWKHYPNYNFVYDKLRLSEIQNIECSPIPLYPNEFPIIVKPIINLFGMSKGFKKVYFENEYKELLDENNLAGYFFQKYFDGKQYNVDLIIKNGKIICYYALISNPDIFGTFNSHYYLKDYKLSDNIKNLLEELLENYTGFLNVEIINEFIIEIHLRFNGDCFIYSKENYDSFITILENDIFDESKLNLKVNNYCMFPIFTNNKNYNKLKLIKYLEENNTIQNFIIDDIESQFQGDYYKRCCYFIIDDYILGSNIKNFILEKII